MNKIQKDYYLREQLKAIQKELGDISDDGQENQYRAKLDELKISDETREKIEKEIEKLERTPSNSPDYSILKNYLDTIFSLPWYKESRNSFDINKS